MVDNSRINADTLYTAGDYSDEGEPVIKGRQKKKKAPMPMGIRRIEHEEDKIMMATAADIEAQDRGLDKVDEQEDDGSSSDGLFVDEVRTTKKEVPHIPAKDEEVWEHALPKSRVKIKDEDGEQMDLDQIPEGRFKAPDSLEQRKKDAFMKESDDKKAKKRKGDTEEDLLTQDLEHLVNLFSIDNSGAKKDGEDKGNTELEGHMFLFQFPPVLPPLTSTAPKAPKADVKPEPTDDDDEDDIVMFAPQKKAPAANIDLTQDADKVKAEDEADEPADNDANAEAGGGFVGNLVVRKSGKVELSWGGKTLLLAPGTQANFLSSAVLLESSDVKPQPGQVSGAAYGMGKIQGSFALVPTWGDEEEWDVDPEDLAIPES